MGCVFAKEVSSSAPATSEIVTDKKRDRDTNVTNHDNRNDTVAGAGDGEAENGVDQKKGNDRSVKPRRRSKPNPRNSNPLNNVHGEQVAAGWPAWLSAVAGEAINGWTPRRADTFEKISKASIHLQ